MLYMSRSDIFEMPDDAQQLEIDNLFYVHIWKSEHFKGDYNTAKQAPLCNLSRKRYHT